MPTLNLTLPKSLWSKDEKAQIAEALTDGLNAVAQTSGKGDIRQHINVQIVETAEGGYALGGKILA